MEALAGIATIVQLVDATAKLAKSVSTLCRNVHDMPAELQNLLDHLNRIHVLLKQISHVEAASGGNFYSTSLSTLQELAVTMDVTVSDLQKRYIKRHNGRPGIGGRLKLALLESNAIKKYSKRIQALEIEFILQLLCSQRLGPVDPQPSAQPDLCGNSTNPRGLRIFTRDKKDGGETSCSRSYFTGKYSQSLGLQFSVVQTRKDNTSQISVHIRLELPFFGSALQLQSRLIFPLCHSVFFYGGGGCPRIIPDNSEFLGACRRGDLSLVREMCRQGDARPEDTSKGNMTPLLYATESGNTELVKFLLANGARVNWTAGRRQTSPLQWAIQHNHLDVVRLLIEHAADLEHVSATGWSPIFYCWPTMHFTGNERSEILRILAEHSVLDFRQTDILDWTALQRAAAFGTSQDIITLLKLGAKPLERTLPLQWSSIHYAVDAGNWNTFSALLPCYGNTLKDMVDDRGWSLLHLAASKGYEQIISYLFQVGANPRLQSQPSRSYLPESLFDRRCTPRDVAEAFGEEQDKVFAQAAQELGIELDQEVYWDALWAVNSDDEC